MTNADTLDRLLLKVKWAKQHIDKLHAVIAAFPAPSGDDSKFIRFKDDPHIQESIPYVHHVPEIPPEISLIAGDILFNLRSALDHLACHLMTVGGGTVTTQTCFPIAQTAPEYKSVKFRRKIEGIRPTAVKLIDAFKPYKGGYFLLWELHELNKIDKHRLLLTACSTACGQSLTPSERAIYEQTITWPQAQPGFVRRTFKVLPRIPMKTGYEFLPVPCSEMDQEMQFLFDIAFDESKIIECKSVLETLYEMSERVFDIIECFSAAGEL